MRTMYAIGIDFGTSNSCVTVATYYDLGDGKVDPEPLNRPEPVSFQHRDTIPTVCFLGDGKDQPPLFGELAEEKAPFYPELTRSGFKLRLGKPGAPGKEAFLLSKQFLAYLRRRAAEYVPLDKQASNVRIETIVGHPVQWTADQREETRQACIQAGFPNVRLEEESLAALYSHLCDEHGAFQPRPGNRVLMVDMGGGTTDFAFLQIPTVPGERPTSEPVDPAPIVPAWGNNRRSYGGRDLDQLILDYLSREWDPDLVKKERQSLLREVRRFKEAFSNRVREGVNEHETLFLVGEKAMRVRLTRQEFESFAGEYIHQFKVLLAGALHEGKAAPRQVTHLVLTGGHSHWYFVDEALREVFPHLSLESRTILRHRHPEQSVARGLAYQPLIQANAGGLTAPSRRAAHAVWLSVPNGNVANTGGDGGQNGAEEPLLLLPRGQTLPYQTRAPLRIKVEQLGMDSKEANVRLRFYSGHRREPLCDRIARFERGFWEQVQKTISIRLPWMVETQTDQFELIVACQVDENELITAELLITRFLKGKAMEVQRQKMKLSTA